MASVKVSRPGGGRLRTESDEELRREQARLLHNESCNRWRARTRAKVRMRQAEATMPLPSQAACRCRPPCNLLARCVGRHGRHDAHAGVRTHAHGRGQGALASSSSLQEPDAEDSAPAAGRRAGPFFQQKPCKPQHLAQLKSIALDVEQKQKLVAQLLAANAVLQARERRLLHALESAGATLGGLAAPRSGGGRRPALSPGGPAAQGDAAAAAAGGAAAACSSAPDPRRKPQRVAPANSSPSSEAPPPPVAVKQEPAPAAACCEEALLNSRRDSRAATPQTVN